jgi:cobalt/nickel transport system permease protein
MHIPDGFVSGSINIVGAVAAAGGVAISTWRGSRETQEQPHTVPLLATTAAFVFAAQMLNFPIGVGTSGHFLGAAAVAALLGPWRACLVMTLVLGIQTFVFADGGLTALGTNVFNMAVVGSFSAYTIMRLLRMLLPVGQMGYLTAVALASWSSVVLVSAACALELAVSGTSPVWMVLPAMMGTHAVIGIGEALITIALLSAVLVARPDVIPDWAELDRDKALPANRRNWSLAAGGLLVAVMLAVFVSPLASSAPDGLEKVAQEGQFMDEAEGGEAWKHSPLPDYSVPGVESEGVSTGLAGLFGTSAIFAAGFCVVKLMGRRSPK